MAFYISTRLSEKISETPEGFLLCQEVPITRTGELIYAASETDISSNTDRVIVSREAKDIFDPATIASFEGKPVTINHPEELVNPDNWKTYAVGVVQNVRAGEGENKNKLVADLLITDREAIYAVKNGLREVSCGYEAEHVEEEPGKGYQKNIIGNHVALVSQGRCGPECAIFDHAAPIQQQEKSLMASLKDKLLGGFKKTLDEAMPEEVAKDESAAEVPMYDQMLGDIKTRLDALDPVMSKLDEIMSMIKGLADMEKQEQAQDVSAEVEEEVEDEKPEGEVVGDMCKDSDIIARAEILAPGIAKTTDVKAKAIKAAMETQDGLAIINAITGNKSPAFDSAEAVDVIFNAASEMMKDKRQSQVLHTKTFDQTSFAQKSFMSAEDMNKFNADFYSKR